MLIQIDPVKRTQLGKAIFFKIGSISFFLSQITFRFLHWTECYGPNVPPPCFQEGSMPWIFGPGTWSVHALFSIYMFRYTTYLLYVLIHIYDIYIYIDLHIHLFLYTYDIHMYAASLYHRMDVAAKFVGANYLDTWIAPQYFDTSKTSGSLQGIIPAPKVSGGLEDVPFTTGDMDVCIFPRRLSVMWCWHLFCQDLWSQCCCVLCKNDCCMYTLHVYLLKCLYTVYDMHMQYVASKSYTVLGKGGVVISCGRDRIESSLLRKWWKYNEQQLFQLGQLGSRKNKLLRKAQRLRLFAASPVSQRPSLAISRALLTTNIKMSYQKWILAFLVLVKRRCWVNLTKLVMCIHDVW